MKYIFEYVGGTKGDMVVRFLNGVEPDISFDRANSAKLWIETEAEVIIHDKVKYSEINRR